MKKKTQKLESDRPLTGAHSAYPELGDMGSGRFLWPFSISFAGHLLFIAAMIFVPKPSFDRQYAPTVINVRMVSMAEVPGGGPAAESVEVEKPVEKAEPAQAEKVETESVSTPPETETPVQVEPEASVRVESEPATPPPAEPPKPEVSLAPKPKAAEKPPAVKEEKKKIKKSLKKETYKPSAIIQEAIKKMEKETETSRPDAVLAAIDRIKKDLAEKPEKAAPKPGPESARSGGGTGGPGSGAEGVRAGYGRPGAALGAGAMDVYYVEIAYQVEKNWAFSEQLARGPNDIEALVGVKIMRDGRVQDVWFDRKSGNKYLDDSAIRAVKKSSPFPPLPVNFRGPFLEVGLRFTPKGVNRH